MMRVQGKTKQLGDDHPVMGQIERVKLRYIKLRQAEQEKADAEKAESRVKIDKEATERIVKNALGARQLREDEQMRAASQRNLMSSSDEDSDINESQAKAKKVPGKSVKKLP